MNLEPPNLGVPLYRRDCSKYRHAVLAGLVAWLWHRPMAIPQAAISFFIGGGMLWFFFASSLSHRIGNHRLPVVRGLWFVLVVVGIVWFMRSALPFLHGLV